MSQLSNIKIWLQPVQLADDHQTHIATLLRWILFAFILLFWGFVPVRFIFLEQGLSTSYPMLFLFIALGTVYLYLWQLVRLGQTHLVSWLVCLSHFSLITTVLIYMQKPVNLAVLHYIITIILVSLLLSNRATILLTMLISVGWLLIFQTTLTAQNNLIFIDLEINSIVSVLLILLLCAGCMSFLQTALKNNIERATQQQATLVAQTHALQQKKESLQTEIKNRTHSLTETVNEAHALQAQLEEVLWLMAGQSWLNKALQGEKTSRHLAQQTVYALCQYLKLPAGAFFVQEGNHFIYHGGFAYVPGKNILESDIIQTHNPQILPASSPYALSINSGLTQMTAPHTMLVPLLHENNVLGIILLASLTPYSQQVKMLCQQASTSIGIALYMARMQQKLSTLT